MTDDLKEYIDNLDIQEMRLVSGDHILAEIIFQDDDNYAIKDPLLLERRDSGFIFTEWLPYSEDQYFSLSKEHIMSSGTLDMPSKMYFCKVTLANRVKKLSEEGYDYDYDMSLLKELNSADNSLIKSSSNEDDEYEWAHALDNTTLQ